VTPPLSNVSADPRKSEGSEAGGRLASRSHAAAGVWRLADPKVSLASVASMFLGAAAALEGGPLRVGWLAVTAVGIFSAEVAKNASGEVFDFDSGTDLRVAEADRSPFSGGKRVLVDGLLSRRQTWAVATAGYGASVATGLTIAVLREPRVLWLGAIGLALAFFYHAPPFRLAYRGLGEIAVGLCYGPLIAAGTYVVQRGTLPVSVFFLGVPLGLAIAAFLWINEFPDYDADRASGKRNLVVRWGRRRACRVFAAVLFSAFAIQALLPLAGLPRGVWLGLVAVVPASDAARIALAHPETTARLVPAQARTLIAFLTLAVAGGIGLVLFA